MFARFIVFVKVLLIRDLGGEKRKPSEATMQAFFDFEEERGVYGEYPSPMEVWEWDRETREKWLRLSVLHLLRWRISVSKVPFTRRSKFLLPKRVFRLVRVGMPL